MPSTASWFAFFSQTCLYSFLIQINRRKVRVKRLIVEKLPEIGLAPEHKSDLVMGLFEGQIKPYLQVFKEGTLAFNSLDK